MRLTIQGQAQMLRTRSRSAAKRGRPVSKVLTTPDMSENTRFGNSFSRISSHRCSCGLSWGESGGNRCKRRFSGMTRSLATCELAPSTTMTIKSNLLRLSDEDLVCRLREFGLNFNRLVERLHARELLNIGLRVFKRLLRVIAVSGCYRLKAA